MARNHICPGELKLAGSSNSPRGRACNFVQTTPLPHRQARESPPSRPSFRYRLLHYFRAKTHQGNASEKASAPEATRAVYSPRLWPAMIPVYIPQIAARCTAMPAISISGWVLTVRFKIIGRAVVDQRPKILPRTWMLRRMFRARRENQRTLSSFLSIGIPAQERRHANFSEASLLPAFI